MTSWKEPVARTAGLFSYFGNHSALKCGRRDISYTLSPAHVAGLFLGQESVLIDPNADSRVPVCAKNLARRPCWRGSPDDAPSGHSAGPPETNVATVVVNTIKFEINKNGI